MPRTLSILLLLCTVLIGCSCTPPTEEFTEVKVTGHGTDVGGEFCSDFNLDEAQARQFFERAAVLDADELHNRFDTLPCYVQGTARLQGAAADWTIRAGGTAEVHTASSNLLLGCNTCGKLFGGESDR